MVSQNCHTEGHSVIPGLFFDNLHTERPILLLSFFFSPVFFIQSTAARVRHRSIRLATYFSNTNATCCNKKHQPNWYCLKIFLNILAVAYLTRPWTVSKQTFITKLKYNLLRSADAISSSQVFGSSNSSLKNIPVVFVTDVFILLVESVSMRTFFFFKGYSRLWLPVSVFLWFSFFGHNFSIVSEYQNNILIRTN